MSVSVSVSVSLSVSLAISACLTNEMYLAVSDFDATIKLETIAKPKAKNQHGRRRMVQAYIDDAWVIKVASNKAKALVFREWEREH